MVEALSDSDQRRVVYQHRRGSRQATLRLKCVLPRATADNFPARVIFSDAFKRLLLLNFREGAGASYHVAADVDVLPGGTAVFDLTADLNHNQLRPVLGRLRRLLASPETIVTTGAFEQLRFVTASGSRLQAATTGAMAFSLFEMWNRGWPLQTLDRQPERALATDVKDVAALAEHCRDNWIKLGLLGDEPRLRAAWTDN